jgi:hypothetical protein
MRQITQIGGLGKFLVLLPRRQPIKEGDIRVMLTKLFSHQWCSNESFRSSVNCLHKWFIGISISLILFSGQSDEGDYGDQSDEDDDSNQRDRDTGKGDLIF